MKDMLSPSDLAEVAIDHALSRADGSQLFVIIEHDSRADLRWARSTLTTNGVRSSVAATVIGFAPVAGGIGTATLSASGPDAAVLTGLVDAVLAAAKHAPAADDAADLIRDVSSGEWGAAPLMIDVSTLNELTTQLGSVFRAGAADGIEHFGYAEHGIETTWMASTTGVRRVHSQPSGRIEMTAKSHARSRSAWQGVATEDLTRADIGGMDLRLRQGLTWQETKLDIAAGRHTAILTPGAVADLMCEFWWTATARDAAEGRSVFSGTQGATRLGEKLTPRNLTISSDPRDSAFTSMDFVAAASSSSHTSVFDNGLNVNPHSWLKDGTLTELAAPRATAADLNVPAAATADCLRIADTDGHGSLDDLIARTQDGLLVTCLWYNRVVDPQSLLLTGLTRDGVYVIRQGEIVGCASNFRFNDSPVGLLPRIVDASATERTLPREMGDYVHRVAAPALAVEGFNFSTVSDAL